MKSVPQLDASRSHCAMHTLANTPNVMWNGTKIYVKFREELHGMRRGSWADKHGRFRETRFLRDADTNMCGVILLETAMFIYINIRIQDLTWRHSDEI